MKRKRVLSKEESEWFSCFFREHHRLMLHKAMYYSRNPHDAEDIVSDCCIDLIRQQYKLKEMTETELIRYISVSVRHAAFHYLKYWTSLKQDVVSLDKQIDNQHPEEVCIRIEQMQMVEKAIDQLTDNEKFALRLKILEGLTDREIADRLGLAVSSVRKYVQRAKAHLCTIIQEEKKHE